ncbi:MlaD family protein [Propionivibrio sp.]|uniref:MlaD family protein n=1 Tax=Propionivibrio sp. TaxID=2212460 RepID=UPI0025F1D4C9|nr:MlaD family protein [Propionivibrio sp.]MBK8401453.1 MCE family protein [Propionivibrio sp.]MBK8745375.1 MCE family protein [Propionivibrio sp.]MBK8894138.1 MCE family protein [Propionivibrio sp.]
MKRDNVNYLLVGSFVLLMAGVLLYALYRITGHSAKGDVYYTHFANVAGIKEGTVVTYEGFEVGNVAQVEPVTRDKRTAYRITLNLRKPVSIPVDSRALIATPGLLSAPLVEIKEGGGSDILAAGGDIPGSSSANLMESVAALATELGQITESTIKPMLVQINRNVAPAMADMRSTIERINRTAGRIDTLFSDQNVQHWSRLLQNADGASANALKLLADLSTVRAEVEDLVKDTRGIVTNGGTGLKDSIRRIDATLYQLESAGRNINEFSRTIRENPAALIQSRPPTDDAGAAK